MYLRFEAIHQLEQIMFRRTAIVCLACLMASACFGCSTYGSFFELVDAFDSGDHFDVVACKSRYGSFMVGLPVPCSKDYYASRVTGSAGVASLADAVHSSLGGDGQGEESQFGPVNGTPLWVRAKHDEGPDGRTRVLVYDVSAHRDRELTSFPDRTGDVRNAGYAFSPSRRHLLVVDEQRVQLWDVLAGTRSEQLDLGPFVKLRMALIDRRGVPGYWWISDDLNYLVVIPSHEIYKGGGIATTSHPMPDAFAGATFDMEKEGLLYDRKAGRVTIVRKALDDEPLGPRVAEVLQTTGVPNLLYTELRRKKNFLIVAGPDGKVLATHDFSMPQGDVRLSSTNTTTGNVTLVGNDRGGPPWVDAHDRRPRIYFVYTWNWRFGDTRFVSLPDALIGRAIKGK